MSNELIILENLSAPEVFKADKVTEILNYVEQRIKEFVPDETTPAGLEAIDEFAWKITKSKTLLKKMGDDYAKYLKEEPKKVDIERKRVVDTLEGWAKQVRKPVTDREDAEKARKEGHETSIGMITNSLMFSCDPTIEVLTLQISTNQRFCANIDWQEYMPRASAEYTRVHNILTQMLNDRIKKDADHAELERLRAEEEERNREKREKEIAEKATKAAEDRAAAEADRVAQETARAIKAEEDRVLEVSRKAIEDAERAEKALKEAQEKAKRDTAAALQKQKDDAASFQKAIEDDAKRRESDIEHRNKINHEIILGIIDIDHPALDILLAEIIMKAIAGGKIPNVSIQY